MGLLLGCSLMTLLEFIDFLWEVVTSKIRKLSRSEDTVPNNSYYKTILMSSYGTGGLAAPPGSLLQFLLLCTQSRRIIMF